MSMRVFVALALVAAGAQAGNILDCKARPVAFPNPSERGVVERDSRVFDTTGCEGAGYYLVSAKVIVPWILGCVCIVMALAFACCRCSGLLGGCNAGPGICCPSIDSKEHQQTYYNSVVCLPNHPCWAKYLLPLVASGLVVISFSTGISGSEKLNDADEDIFPSIYRGVDELFDGRIAYQEANLKQRNNLTYIIVPGGGGTTETIVTETKSAKVDVEKEVRDIEDDYNDDYDGQSIYDPIAYVLAFSSVPFIVVAFILGCCNCGRNYSACGNGCGHIALSLAFLVGGLVWIWLGAVSSGLMVTEDACFEVDNLPAVPAPAVPGQVAEENFGKLRVDVIYKACPDLRSTINTARRYTDDYAREICSSYARICDNSATYDAVNGRLFECPESFLATCNTGAVTYQRLTQNVDLEMMKLKTGVPAAERGSCSGTCVAEQCRTDCGNSGATRAKDQATGYADSVLYGKKIQDVLTETLESLEGCDELRKVSKNHLSGLCGDFKDAVTEYQVSAAFSGLAFLFIIASLWLGVKRFIPKEDVNTPNETAEHTEMQPDDKNAPYSDETV